MSITRPLPLVLLTLAIVVTATPSQARSSAGTPGQYKIRCVNSECSDRYHYRAPKGESSHPAGSSRSRSSRY